LKDNQSIFELYQNVFNLLLLITFLKCERSSKNLFAEVVETFAAVRGVTAEALIYVCASSKSE